MVGSSQSCFQPPCRLLLADAHGPDCSAHGQRRLLGNPARINYVRKSQSCMVGGTPRSYSSSCVAGKTRKHTTAEAQTPCALQKRKRDSSTPTCPLALALRPLGLPPCGAVAPLLPASKEHALLTARIKSVGKYQSCMVSNGRDHPDAPCSTDAAYRFLAANDLSCQQHLRAHLWPRQCR